MTTTEFLALKGVLETAFELDGGVHLTLSNFADMKETSFRNKGSFCAAVDEARALKSKDAAEVTGRNIEAWLLKQEAWSRRTFGSGRRTGGLIDHIQKELVEIRENPHDLEEWIDVIILALDGYWRHGGDPNGIMDSLIAKWEKNFARQWPGPASEDVAVEHIREAAEEKPKRKWHVHGLKCGVPPTICGYQTERRQYEANFGNKDHTLYSLTNPDHDGWKVDRRKAGRRTESDV